MREQSVSLAHLFFQVQLFKSIFRGAMSIIPCQNRYGMLCHQVPCQHLTFPLQGTVGSRVTLVGQGPNMFQGCQIGDICLGHLVLPMQQWPPKKIEKREQGQVVNDK